jgi:hypothetical protein
MYSVNNSKFYQIYSSCFFILGWTCEYGIRCIINSSMWHVFGALAAYNACSAHLGLLSVAEQLGKKRRETIGLTASHTCTQQGLNMCMFFNCGAAACGHITCNELYIAMFILEQRNQRWLGKRSVGLPFPIPDDPCTFTFTQLLSRRIPRIKYVVVAGLFE